MYRVGTILLLSLSCVQAQSSNSSEASLTMYLDWLLPTDNITQLSDLSDNLGLLHCNTYCNGSTESRYVLRACSTPTPTCKPCHCDEDCHTYSDCCPDENGEVSMKIQTEYDCVSSGDNSYYRYGDYLMITSCPHGTGLNVSSACATSPDEVAPVTSVTSNVTHINECIAACNNDTNYIAWTKEVICKDIENITDFSNGNSSTDCITYLYPPLDSPVRRCNPIFSEPKYIDTCNTTGLSNGSTFDVDVDVQCKEWHYYPVAAKGYVFKNIYCFLCNGFMPTIQLCRFQTYSDISINTLIRTSSDPDKPQCQDYEWYDHIKKVCRHMYCRQGYGLNGGTCVMSSVDLPNVQYHFNAVFWSPENHTSYLQLKNWNNIESMVVQNLPQLLSAYNISDCLFALYNIIYTNHENSSEIIPIFSLSLMFRTEQNCCRTEFEQHLSELVGDTWIFNHNGSRYEFSLSDGDFYSYDTAESQTYKMMSPDLIPVETDATFLDYNGQVREYIYLPIIYEQCAFVYLYAEDFSWNDDKSITLGYADITIQQGKFMEHDDQMVICVDTLKELYNKFHPPLDPIQQAENIVSLSFSVLSLVCLTLTFITYCAFPSLLTLPTKNTMCLVVFLFVAQLLLQFGNLASRDETTCKVIGALLHYFWLSVIFWMNVCSYHMFHVFVIDAAKPISIKTHHTRLLKYFLYANGSSLIIVIITIGANLGATSGNQMGYGNGTCYLSTALLRGVSFVLPLGIILISNIIFFSISVWTMVKIHKMSQTIGQEKSQVHIYMKLSTLTGIFWVLSILAETLHLQFLVFISIILNASQGVFIFISYMANRRIYQLWMEKFSQYTGFVREQSTESTKTSRM